MHIAKCTYTKPKQKQYDFQHSWESTLSVMFSVFYMKNFQFGKEIASDAFSDFSVYVCGRVLMWRKSMFL